MFNLVSINKCQRSRLTFDLSAKVAQTKFHMTTHDWLAKTYTNCHGHMTDMATIPIYGKNSLNLFFSGTKRPLAVGLGM